MAEALQFDPAIVAWWQTLRDLPDKLGRIRVWRPRDHPPAAGSTLEQHGTTTLVACLAGQVRIEDVDDRCDLGAGEVLLLRAGTWHRHAALRPGALAFSQGSIAGRSDFFLDTADAHVVGSVPTQPSLDLMERAARAADHQRADLVADLIRNMTREQSTPLTSPHPALLRMEFALWRHLHQAQALARILAASGLQRAQAFRVCRAHWGAGPAEILRRERLRLARELLDDGVAVGDAALRCGFASRRAFTRAFQAQYGVAPSRSTTAR